MKGRPASSVAAIYGSPLALTPGFHDDYRRDQNNFNLATPWFVPLLRQTARYCWALLCLDEFKCVYQPHYMWTVSWRTVNKCKIVYFRKKLANRTIVKANITFNLNLKNIYWFTLLYKNIIVLVFAGFFIRSVNTCSAWRLHCVHGVLFSLFWVPLRLNFTNI